MWVLFDNKMLLFLNFNDSEATLHTEKIIAMKNVEA
jgi:hypothetical protein